MAVLILAALPFCSFLGQGSVLAREQSAVSNEATSSAKPEVVLYLRSGEVIKGNLLEKGSDKITIDKNGAVIAVDLDEVLRIQEEKSGEAIEVKRQLPFKTAIITYQYKGLQSGEEIVYIDVEKNKIASESELTYSMAGIGGNQKKIEVFDGTFRTA